MKSSIADARIGRRCRRSGCGRRGQPRASPASPAAAGSEPEWIRWMSSCLVVPRWSFRCAGTALRPAAVVHRAQAFPPGVTSTARRCRCRASANAARRVRHHRIDERRNHPERICGVIQRPIERRVVGDVLRQHPWRAFDDVLVHVSDESPRVLQRLADLNLAEAGLDRLDRRSRCSHEIAIQRVAASTGDAGTRPSR